MSKSIMQQGEPQCFLCNTIRGLERHHVMFGIRFRSKAERDGLWVYLCQDHHRGRLSPHGCGRIDRDLKAFAQLCYEETHSREEWMREYGRNYLKLNFKR